VTPKLSARPSAAEWSRPPLTRKQRQILDYIEGYVDSHRGVSPSYEEIAEGLSYSSLATVHEHITNLVDKGYLTRDHNKARSIQFVRASSGSGVMDLELCGTVAAGRPLDTWPEQHWETVSVPADMVGRGEHYVLRVQGESMIDALIGNGDYIVVSSRHTAENGETAVALIDDEAATVKKVYREPGGRVRLQPANPAMEPMYYPAERVQIQGVVVGVIRKF